MNSAERLLEVLGLFDEDRADWTPDQMMEATGFTRPTLYRYLKALRDAGLIVSSGSSYTLGPKVMELDFLMRRSDPVIEAGQGVLERLSALHPGSAFLVRWYGRRILCIASEVSAPEPRSSYPRGRPMPLAQGAISRAILAWLPKKTQEEIGTQYLADFARAGTGRSIEEIRAKLRAVRRDGVAVARGEVTQGVVGIAAPIFDSGAVPVAALAFTADESETNTGQITVLRARVRDFAQSISERLGGGDATRRIA
jgi:DNA-binding IclR family transcriptional regulator